METVNCPICDMQEYQVLKKANYSENITCIYETVVNISYDKKEGDKTHHITDTYDSSPS